MRVDIIHKHKTLRRICHEGQVYVMAPTKGSYKISLYNHCNQRRLAVITVDGVNILSGKDGNFEGQGYIIGPWETIEIPGWKRDGKEGAAFVFRPEEASYANQTGRGTKNVGVIGVAVFDEYRRPPPVPVYREEHHHHHYGYTPPPVVIYSNQPRPTYSNGMAEIFCTNTGSSTGGTIGSSTDSVSVTASTTVQIHEDSARIEREENTSGGVPGRRHSVVRKSMRSGTSSSPLGLFDCAPNPEGAEYERERSVDVGTGYGQKIAMEVTTTTFTRATTQPAEIVVLRYATRERLQTWGIPVNKMVRESPQTAAQPFPASPVGVPAPPGWRG